jgi:GDP-D-mannose 3',5'-epimerase
MSEPTTTASPRALVCGAAGFIGGHLVSRLKRDGFWVRGVDVVPPSYRASDADEFVVADLRSVPETAGVFDQPFDHVYQLAADMGGMEFIGSAAPEILQNSAMINLNVIGAAARTGVKRYFFSSSVCVYRDMGPEEQALTEDDAYPAQPDNEYGWEKLYAERVLTAVAAATDHGMQARIARFENTYGPYGSWTGGREKAPAAICRKVAEADANDGVIEAFGDGTAVRCFTYVDDLVEGIRLLTEGELTGPVNLGSGEYVTVNELIDTIARVAGKQIRVEHIDGPVGVRSRNFSGKRAESLGFRPHFSLEDGIRVTYEWIEEQVRKS